MSLLDYSLLTRTDLIAQAGRQIEGRDGYAVVRTPTSPTFYGGNGLVLASPMSAADLEEWEETFTAELPRAKHRYFEWPADGLADVDRAAFEAAGYDCSVCAAMTLTSPRLDQPINPYLRVEPVRSDPAWLEVIAFWLACYPDVGVAYLARRAADFASQKSAGDWWVARDGAGTVVGSMGLYFGEGMGRFQNVDTHPNYRRQGVCRTLMHGVLTHAVAAREFDELVIAADEAEFTPGLYASFGFERVAAQVDILRPPADPIR